jgi:hypothetical protein
MRTIMSIKGSVDWRAWLADLAVHTRLMSKATVIDVALADYAEKIGFRPPPRR